MHLIEMRLKTDLPDYFNIFVDCRKIDRIDIN